jgi:hypothetical protein
MIPFIQLVSSTSVSSCPYSQQRLHNNRSRMGAATRAPLTAAGASWSVFCRVITTSGHNDKITLSGASLELHFSTKMSLKKGGQKWTSTVLDHPQNLD